MIEIDYDVCFLRVAQKRMMFKPSSWLAKLLYFVMIKEGRNHLAHTNNIMLRIFHDRISHEKETFLQILRIKYYF